MNIIKECNKRIKAYNEGYQNAKDGKVSLKGLFKKSEQKAYQNGYTEGQLVRQVLKKNPLVDI